MLEISIILKVSFTPVCNESLLPPPVLGYYWPAFCLYEFVF